MIQRGWPSSVVRKMHDQYKHTRVYRRFDGNPAHSYNTFWPDGLPENVQNHQYGQLKLFQPTPHALCKWMPFKNKKNYQVEGPANIAPPKKCQSSRKTEMQPQLRLAEALVHRQIMPGQKGSSSHQRMRRQARLVRQRFRRPHLLKPNQMFACRCLRRLLKQRSCR